MTRGQRSGRTNDRDLMKAGLNEAEVATMGIASTIAWRSWTGIDRLLQMDDGLFARETNAQSLRIAIPSGSGHRADIYCI